MAHADAANDTSLEARDRKLQELLAASVLRDRHADDGGMLPLGALPHAGSMEMRVPTLLRQDSRFKVSIESAASAPVERPSQEIVFEGKLTSI